MARIKYYNPQTQKYEYADNAVGRPGKEGEPGKDGYSPYVTPQTYGARADGVTDDTAAIQAALDASSYVYIPDGVYMVDAVTGLLPHSNQVIELASGAVLKVIGTSSGSYSVIHLQDVENVRIRGGKIQGDNAYHTGTSGDSGFGVFVDVAKRVVVEDMEIADCWGDCIMIGYRAEQDSGGTYYGVQSEDIVIQRCKLHGGRRQGISVCSGLDVVIRDCEVYDITQTAPKSGIDIEPDWVGVAKNVLIENCYIHDTASASIIIGGNIEGNTTAIKDDIRIVGCTVDGINIQPGLTTNVSVSDTTFGTVYFCTEDILRVDNCQGKRAVSASGNAVFTNCRFASNVALIGTVNDVIAERPNSDLLSFIGCTFEMSGTTESSYFLKLATHTTGATAHADRVIELISCKIELDQNTHLMNRTPGEELRMMGCDVRFAKAPSNMKMIQINNVAAVKAIVHNCTFVYTGTENQRHYALVEASANGSVEVDIAYSSFHRTKHLMTCNNTPSAKLRLLNNKMTVEDATTTGNAAVAIEGTNALMIYNGGVV